MVLKPRRPSLAAGVGPGGLLRMSKSKFSRLFIINVSMNNGSSVSMFLS